MVDDMNTLAKGKRHELECRKLLEEYGFKVFKPIWNRYGEKDIFGHFDMIAINNLYVLLVQVKTKTHTKKVYNDIKAFEVPRNVIKLIMVRMPKKVFKIIEVK